MEPGYIWPAPLDGQHLEDETVGLFRARELELGNLSLLLQAIQLVVAAAAAAASAVACNVLML